MAEWQESFMTSKTTTSNNTASMYIALKDHKPGDKSRPIVTGHSSNTRGMSNSVSDVLEAVANSERRPEQWRRYVGKSP